MAPISSTDPDAFRISETGCATLLALARNSIREHLAGERNANFSETSGELSQRAGVFVTLTKADRLRGCVGMTETAKALWQTTAEMAVAAAVHDHRFPRVTQSELDDIRIEISILSPLRRVASAENIRPGVHGVSVRQGLNRGLFLPQVWESLPSKEDFLGELCSQKAGLDPEAWKQSDVVLEVFTVFAFEEELTA